MVFIDEIDTVRSLPFSTDEFFAAIRECYNRRTEEPEYEGLTFCLLGVATPSDLIRDTRLTPFNIGRRIELEDFTEAESGRLAAGLVVGQPGTPFRSEREAKALLRRVLHWTSGHPYLTQRLCRAVAATPTHHSPLTTHHLVDARCEELFLSARAREKDDNLLFVRDRLLRGEADLAGLLDLYGRVRSGRRVPPDDTNRLLDVLRLSGVVRLSGRHLVVRNRIYAHVFDRTWIGTHMPDAEVRRQRDAYRRGVLRTVTVAAALLAVMAV